MTKIIKIFTIILFSIFLSSCNAKKTETRFIAVFAPGILADSPTYAMLAEGVKQAVEEYNKDKTASGTVKFEIIEAGTNQAEWGAKLTALTAEMKYSVIISSNPSIPDLAEPLTQQFPQQKYIILDAQKEGNENIATVCYNQREQSYLNGYIAGLMSKSHKIGLIAAQEYPVMNEIILPGFTEGAKAADKLTNVDFRIVGNWYNASKGRELADAMHKTGIDIILPICGGAAQGVITAAKENGFYLTWFDSNGFSKAPQNIIASSVIKQTEMAAWITKKYLDGEIEWGKAETVGIKEGYVDFIQDDPNYISNVPQNIRSQMAEIIEAIKAGILNLPQ